VVMYLYTLILTHSDMLKDCQARAGNPKLGRALRQIRITIL